MGRKNVAFEVVQEVGSPIHAEASSWKLTSRLSYATSRKRILLDVFGWFLVVFNFNFLP